MTVTHPGLWDPESRRWTLRPRERDRSANLTDFPGELIDPYDIEVIDPDRFIINHRGFDPIHAIAAVNAMRARWKRTGASPSDFAAAFDQSGLFAIAQGLREVAGTSLAPRKSDMARSESGHVLAFWLSIAGTEVMTIRPSPVRLRSPSPLHDVQ